MDYFTPQETYIIEGGSDKGAFNLSQGETYVIHPLHRDALQSNNKLKGQFRTANNDLTNYAKQTLNNKKLCLFLMGGLGDMICLTPVVIALKQQYPAATIDIITHSAAHDLIKAGGFQGQCLNYPPTREVLNDYDYVFVDQRPINYPQFKTQTTSTLYANLLNITGSIPTPNLDGWKKSSNKNIGEVNIGIQYCASHQLKSYPERQMLALIRLLQKANYHVHLFGKLGDCQLSNTAKLSNHCLNDNSLKSTATLLQTMNLVVAPDSFVLHLAGALNIPCIALLALFPAHLRTDIYPSVTAIVPEKFGEFYLFEPQTLAQGQKDAPAFSNAALTPRKIFTRIQEIAE